MAPPIPPSSSAEPVSPKPPVDPNPEPVDPDPKPLDPNPPEKENTEDYYHQLELNAGVAFTVPDSVRLALGVTGFPLPWLALGATGLSNFSDKHAFLAKAGYRFRANESFSFQPTLVGGVGILKDSSTVGGRLAEEALLNGAYPMVGGEVQFHLNPLDWLGIYVAPGFMHEARGKTEASPTLFPLSGEEPNTPQNYFTLNFGVEFGVLPNRSAPEEEKSEESEKVEAPEPSSLEAPKSFEEKVEERKTKIVEALKQNGKESAAQALAEKIDSLKMQMSRYKKHLSQWRDGIGSTHRIAERLQISLDDLSSNPDADLGSKLGEELDLLIAATEWDDTQKKFVSKAPDLQVGLRLLYPPAKSPYGDKILGQLKELEVKLRTRENEHEKVKQAIAHMEKFKQIKEVTSTIALEALQDEEDKIKPAFDELKSEGQNLGLQENEDWKSLNQEFEGEQNVSISFHHRVENYVRLSALFQSEANEFRDKVGGLMVAQKTFQEANEFLEEQFPSSSHKTDISIGYADYLNFLNNNLDKFIKSHTAPALDNPVLERHWQPAVEEAQKTVEKLRERGMRFVPPSPI